MSVPTVAERAIRQRIARHGPITFAEYMGRALYGPGGYYTRRSVGSDYYTSPQVHPAFGALLAVQLFHFWQLLDKPDPFAVIEPGGESGLLGHDVCRSAVHLPEGFAAALRYIVADRHRSAGTTAGETAAIVADALRMPFRNVVGCVLSNELLDALPVHRVRMEEGTLRELYVGIESDVADGYEGQLTEATGDPSDPGLERRLSEIGINLRDGQTAEICLLLDDWASSIAGSLDAGFVMTIDYGRSAADLYDPAQRPRGTLVTYRSHRQTDSPLADTGRQDITAQVDFTSAQTAGERAGLTTLANISQAQFLTGLGLQTIRRNGPPPEPGNAGWITIPVGSEGELPDVLGDPFAQPLDESRDWLTGLTDLVRPGGLGDFRVLIQSKGVAERVADAAGSWLGTGERSSDYALHELAAMIPADALALGPERFRLSGPAML